MIRPFTAAIATLLMATTSGHTEGRISFTADAADAARMTMTERWSGSALRTDIDGMDAYMLLRDDSVYSIISMDGRITVMDLGQMQDMPGAGANQTSSQNQAGVVFPDEIVTVEKSGDTREIAGIKGDVHEIEWVDNAGEPRTDTAVLTDDPRLLKHQTLKMKLIRAISGEAPNPLMVDLQDRGLAALSFGDRYKVTEVRDDAGPAEDFELPAEPMDFGNMTEHGQPVTPLVRHGQGRCGPDASPLPLCSAGGMRQA